MNHLNFLGQSSAICLGIYSIFSIPFITPVMAQEQILRTLTVTGEGIERISTTLTEISLGVEISGKTATEVQENVAQRTSAVVSFLKSRQVEHLETTGIGLQPNYQYDNNQRRLVGYIGTNTVSFRLKTEAVGGLLDEAVKAGATRIDNVSFTATETAISQAQKKALQSATLDAQQQAKAVLDTLNFQSQEIINIAINGANVPKPQLIQAAETFKTTANAPPITPVIGGEQTVRASVTLQIRY
ncbi:SIMPL domain-containing protein [Crocosphaera sp. UHCC 0190]|uniref:SIMPL domain-containing protein n=1 Tax=Crocosphaera sp. UHCC 0190 TaxID=3110246 RepID=UPI002B2175DD|nr:SIMPL domain-containing protein [Crocosphaera sp. UHCC 0190]MEA5511518.1 SIMPL domain-containing protein [Crocosphaera sp. UHCC 0190]